MDDSTKTPEKQEKNAVEVFDHDAVKDLVAKAEQEHDLGIAAGRQTIEHFRKAGELLIEAKAKHRHGGWLLYLEKGLKSKINTRTAQRYMRLAKNWTTITSKVETTRVSQLSIREAIAAINKTATFAARVPADIRDKAVRRALKDDTHIRKAVVDVTIRPTRLVTTPAPVRPTVGNGGWYRKEAGCKWYPPASVLKAKLAESEEYAKVQGDIDKMTARMEQIEQEYNILEGQIKAAGLRAFAIETQTANSLARDTEPDESEIGGAS